MYLSWIRLAYILRMKCLRPRAIWPHFAHMHMTKHEYDMASVLIDSKQLLEFVALSASAEIIQLPRSSLQTRPPG